MFRIVFFCLLIVCFSCKEEQKQSSAPQQDIGFTKEGELQLLKKDTDSLIASLNIEFAKSDYETQTGLMYRKSMNPNEGMLFIFKDEQPRSFYMKNTLIPLDIIYLNKDKAVVSIQKNAKPLDESSLPSEQPAMYVLEVNAGLSEVWKISNGDYIVFN
ncbi:DUF192 domain-containing protein [Aurantibacter aestuarii]|uniref:DUF192 domain-containing protein n=1 Tax=Aurantibacter aestuarii TaxID=1266046 RepID=A0A2T1NG62_9FLAO|nr:DUF192 domain-containing protein [Aurantibacter aestuarii]PSG91765.1 hypothetical protein C7H52_01215 [Aurantibacter aestuarii]